MTDRPMTVSGRALITALIEAGVVNHGDRVRRVIIDAHVNHPTVLHVERYGDERLLGITHALDGAEIIRHDPGATRPAAPA